jgi:hypothetical protein
MFVLTVRILGTDQDLGRLLELTRDKSARCTTRNHPPNEDASNAL